MCHGLSANFDQFTDRFFLDEDDNAEIRLVDSDRGTSSTFRSDIITEVF